MRSRYLLLIVSAISVLVQTSSAATQYASQYYGVTMLGPTGVGVSLGFPAEYMYFYNYISLGFLFLIATSASERNSSFFALLLPLFAAMFAWWGWLVVPTGSQLWGIVICCGVLAVAVYMKGKQQEKFGIAGPGSPFLNIVFWMIVIQASIGFINASGLFAFNPSVTPDQYQTVQLSTTVPNIAGTGGWWNTITSDAYLIGSAAFAAWGMLWGALSAIVNFKALVISIAPFMATSPLVDTLLTVITIGIDFIIAIAVWMWLFKPPLGETV